MMNVFSLQETFAGRQVTKKGCLMNMKSQNCMEQIENLTSIIVKYIHFYHRSFLTNGTGIFVRHWQKLLSQVLQKWCQCSFYSHILLFKKKKIKPMVINAGPSQTQLWVLIDICFA